MSPRKVVIVALATQAGLAVGAWWAGRVLNLPLGWGAPLRDAAVGSAVALALAFGNYQLLTRAPGSWIVDGLRAVYREVILPIFGRLGPVAAIAIGAAAGIGEEWLFRGVVQPLMGLVAASVLFGLAHVGGVRMLAFGVWATCMGLVMGALTIVTGGLTAPMVAHGLYDVLALQYVRHAWQRTAAGGGGPAVEGGVES